MPFRQSPRPEHGSSVTTDVGFSALTDDIAEVHLISDWKWLRIVFCRIQRSEIVEEKRIKFIILLTISERLHVIPMFISLCQVPQSQCCIHSNFTRWLSNEPRVIQFQMIYSFRISIRTPSIPFLSFFFCSFASIACTHSRETVTRRSNQYKSKILIAKNAEPKI